jgi:hypothetical protein
MALLADDDSHDQSMGRGRACAKCMHEGIYTL